MRFIFPRGMHTGFSITWFHMKTLFDIRIGILEHDKCIIEKSQNGIEYTDVLTFYIKSNYSSDNNSKEIFI